jgi:hypothetical protein
MSGTKSARKAWDKVRADAGDGVVRIARGGIPHPRDAGARVTTTWPVGQIADYALDDAAGQAPLAIREFSDQWQAFLMTAQVTNDIFKMIDKNPRAAFYTGAALVGGVVGTSVAKSKEGMLLGACLGVLVATLLDDGAR